MCGSKQELLRSRPESFQLLQVSEFIVSVWFNKTRYHYIEFTNRADGCLIYFEIRIAKNNKLVEDKELIQLLDDRLRQQNLITSKKI